MRQLKPLILLIGINFGCGGKAKENSNGGGSPPSTGGMSANTGGTANGGSPHTGGDSGDGDTIVFSGGAKRPEEMAVLEERLARLIYFGLTWRR